MEIIKEIQWKEQVYEIWLSYNLTFFQIYFSQIFQWNHLQSSVGLFVQQIMF